MIGEAFSTVLRNGRDEFNGRFAQARRLQPTLDGDAFGQFLETGVDPLINLVAAEKPEAVVDVVTAAYSVALELVGQRLAGPSARHAVINEGWALLLPAAAVLVAEDPARILSAVSNALHQLATTPGARPEQWRDELEKLLPKVTNVEQFLQLGQVLAWRAGLAHFRSGALAVLDGMPEALALAALGKPDGLWPELRARLAADPWSEPGAGLQGFRFVTRVGGFRGFGGLFTEPPVVACAGGDFLVRSGDNYWVLTADPFGATFHRATAEEFTAATQRLTPPPMVRVDGNRVTWNGCSVEVPLTGPVTSSASDERTLVLTAGLSHRLYLLALGS